MEVPQTIILSVLWLLAGLGLFLYGIDLLGASLRKAAGPALRKAFDFATGTRLRGILAGTLVTALVQSSSATTVMIVGFINAGLLTLEQSISVILGANLGTTVTSQITARGMEGVAIPLLGIGFVVSIAFQRRALRHTGLAIMGTGMLFLGLILMKDASREYSTHIQAALEYVSGGHAGLRILAFLVAMAATAIIQSSAATLVMIQASAFAGAIHDIELAIPLILGAEVGTCITAILASLRSSRSAKRAALAHLLFNVIGTLITVLLYRFYLWAIPRTAASVPQQIANAHLLIRLVNVACFLPFTAAFSRLVTRLFPGQDKLDACPAFLDYHACTDSARALMLATREITRMFHLSMTLLQDTVQAFLERDTRHLELVKKREDLIDDLHFTIADYIMRLARNDLPKDQLTRPALWMHVMNDVERIGDHAENIAELAATRLEDRGRFSREAIEEVRDVLDRVVDLGCSVQDAMEHQTPAIMAAVLRKKEALNVRVDEVLDRHETRLSEGTCGVIAGIIFVELVMNLRRVANHLRNIAASATSHAPEHTLLVQRMREAIKEES
jgi:phosphate:Na+ symporter